ncbi:gag/pol polyprotein [Tanacetum coccineum]
MILACMSRIDEKLVPKKVTVQERDLVPILDLMRGNETAPSEYYYHVMRDAECRNVVVESACYTTRKAEYKALADTVAELTYLQALLHELGIRSSSTPILWCDNLDATYLSANPIFRARTKHVEIDYHFVREKVAQGDLRVQHISTHD